MDEKTIETARKIVETVATERAPYREVDARLFAAGVLLICNALTRPLTPEEAFGEPVESTLGKAIVEVSEMAGHRRAEIEAIKAFITRQDDGAVRLAYARETTRPPERAKVLCRGRTA